MIQSFRDLIVWRRAMQFTKEVYMLTKRFPKEETYGLPSQLRRSAVSVPSNIAEGHARQGNEFPYFLSIARGSLAEAECQLLLAVDLSYLKQDDIAAALGYATEIRKMSSALCAKIS